MKLDKLLERLDYTVVQGSDSTEVTTLINDSRKVEEGSVFVCISGAVSDGHKYAADVAAKGAAAVVVEKDVEVPENVTVIKVEDTRYALALMSAAYFGYPADKMKVIGITEGRPCARRTEDRRCCGVCLITDPFVCFRYGKRNRTAPDSNRFYGQFHYH